MSHQPPSHPGLHRALSEAMELVLDWNATGKESIRTLNTYFVAAVLKRYDGNQCRAARRLGIHRNTMGRQIEEFHLEALVDQLRGKQRAQLKLFHGGMRRAPARAGYAQDAVVLHRKPQAIHSAFSQQIRRAKAGSS